MKLSKFRLLILVVMLFTFLAGCSTETPDVEYVEADLPSLGPAPELENEIWLNTDQPLRLKDLQGSVVLLEMWTYG